MMMAVLQLYRDCCRARVASFTTYGDCCRAIEASFITYIEIVVGQKPVLQHA